MKKTLLLILAFVSGTTFAVAQVSGRSLKKVMELQMPRTTDDDMPGTRGASVAWHPVQKKYYASFAGNAGYPHAVFNMTGKRISGDELNTDVDTRGLWYNAKTKKISGNGYASNGWFNYTLDPKTGIPSQYNIEFEGTNQPNDQCVGTYNPLANEVLFLDGDNVVAYSAADAKEKDGSRITLHWGRTKSQGVAEKKEGEEDVTGPPEGYNKTTIIFSGIAGAEIGVLNTIDRQVELYNGKTGFMTQKLKIPEDAVLEESFNFAYANGIYWLFNIEERKWIGYK